MASTDPGDQASSPKQQTPQRKTEAVPLKIVSEMTNNFSLKIAQKLTDSNFLLWKQQVEPVITSHRLQQFLVNPTIPDKFLNDADQVLENFNPLYLAWEQQDAHLLTWLQSTLSCDVLTQMIGCKHSYQLWERLHSDFFTRTEAKSRQLRTELRNLKLGSKTISEYLQKVKSITDSFTAIGDPVPYKEQVDVLLDGLPSEYESLVNLISMNTKFQSLTIQEIGALLQAQEARVDKNLKTAAAEFSVNAVNTGSNSLTPNVSCQPGGTTNTGHHFGYAADYGGRGGKGRGRGYVQCQVCFKPGHTAAYCYHRFNQNYVPPRQSQNYGSTQPPPPTQSYGNGGQVNHLASPAYQQFLLLRPFRALLLLQEQHLCCQLQHRFRGFLLHLLIPIKHNMWHLILDRHLAILVHFMQI